MFSQYHNSTPLFYLHGGIFLLSIRKIIEYLIILLITSYTIYEITIPSTCNEDFSSHYRENVKRRSAFSQFIMNIWIHKQSSRRGFNDFLYSLHFRLPRRTKGRYETRVYDSFPLGTFLCPAGMNKQNMNIQREAASNLPRAIRAGANAALPCHAQQKSFFITTAFIPSFWSERKTNRE